MGWENFFPDRSKDGGYRVSWMPDQLGQYASGGITFSCLSQKAIRSTAVLSFGGVKRHYR